MSYSRLGRGPLHELKGPLRIFSKKDGEVGES